MASLAELQERRAWECRLTPDRALESVDEAEQFLRERGMLTRTADCALPSLYEACHEDPYAPGSPGFGQWPLTKWWWFGAVGERDAVYTLKIHRGKNLLLTEETAALADPILRSELARMERDSEDWALLLRHLERTGPSLLEDLQRELDLQPRELKAIRSPLERCGAIVARALALATADAEGHEHSSELARWDQVFPQPSPRGGVDDLIVAGVRAAVVAPERDLRRWFSWNWFYDSALVDRLVAAGRLVRPEPGWVALPDS